MENSLCSTWGQKRAEARLDQRSGWGCQLSASFTWRILFGSTNQLTDDSGPTQLRGTVLSCMEKHRSSYRRRVFKSGAIEFSGSTLPCLVRNISETGAAFEITSPFWFPDTFALVIQSDRLRRDCRIVWRKDRQIGVAFVDSHSP